MKNFLLLFIALLAVGTTSQAKTPTLAPVLDLADHYEFGVAFDKNNKACPIIVDVVGSSVVYSILGDGFEVIKSFTIKNAYNDSEGNTTEPIGMDGRQSCFYSEQRQYDEPLAVQGLLDDEDKRVVALLLGGDYYSGPFAWYDEDGEKILEYEGDSSDNIPCYIFDKWYVCHNQEQIMTFRSNDVGSEIARVSDVIKSRVYPNPARKSDMVKVELNESAESDTQLELIDMNGRVVTVVKAMEGDTFVSFEASHLPSGAYLYSVSSGGKNTDRGKIIIR